MASSLLLSLALNSSLNLGRFPQRANPKRHKASKAEIATFIMLITRPLVFLNSGFSFYRFLLLDYDIQIYRLDESERCDGGR